MSARTGNARKATKRKYAAAQYPVDVREAIGKITASATKKGISIDTMHEILQDAGYDIAKSSLKRYKKSANDTGHVLALEKKSGASKSLGTKQVMILVGWVLHKEDMNEEVGGKLAQAFIEDILGIKVSVETARTYMVDNELSSRLMKTAPKGYSMTDLQLADMYIDWMNQHRGSIYKYPRGHTSHSGPGASPQKRPLLCSWDFTFTSHRTQRYHSYSRIGGQQPKLSNKLSKYTNAILTCVWSDGRNRTPALMFTYNPLFRTDRPLTQIRTRNMKQRLAAFEASGVDPSRVVYVGELKGEKHTYVSERADLVQRFVEKYKDEFDQADFVLSDMGGAFTDAKAKFFSNSKARVLYYPAPVHQFMSPNDNMLHGAAKGMWRNMGLDFKDDLESSTMLLHCIDYQSELSRGHVARWFKRNLCLETGKVDNKKALDLISRRTGEKEQWYRNCAHEYKVFIDSARTGKDMSGLSGKYYAGY
jgi:hypothetical protein